MPDQALADALPELPSRKVSTRPATDYGEVILIEDLENDEEAE